MNSSQSLTSTIYKEFKIAALWMKMEIIKLRGPCQDEIH